MFTKSGIIELHSATHDSLDVLLRHIASVPDNLLRQPLVGFGFPTVCKQLVHMLTVIAALLAEKRRIHDATRAYLETLSEEQLNTPLAQRPEGWSGELRSPAFILLHTITHTFHHKGQVVAMLRALGHPAPDTDLQRG